MSDEASIALLEQAEALQTVATKAVAELREQLAALDQGRRVINQLTVDAVSQVKQAAGQAVTESVAKLGPQIDAALAPRLAKLDASGRNLQAAAEYAQQSGKRTDLTSLLLAGVTGGLIIAIVFGLLLWQRIGAFNQTITDFQQTNSQQQTAPAQPAKPQPTRKAR
jgi:phage I-like protein